MNNPKTKTPRLAFGKLLLNESRLALRVPIGLGAGLGLPILLLVINDHIEGACLVNRESFMASHDFEKSMKVNDGA